MSRLFNELKRRNVLRMAALYVAAAWLLIQVVDQLLEFYELPPTYGQVLVALLAIGFPIALLLSWFYELTPGGISLEQGIAPGESITRVTGRRMDFIVIALLAAALILFAYDKWWMHAPLEQSIVVLPFENLSADPEQEYFSSGLTETLLHMLAQIPDLKVAARTSSFAFEDQDKTIQEIASVLRVAYVLEGSVQRVGNRVRITAQLIRAEDGFHVWSENYDRTYDDIFGVQDEIAAKVGGALSASLLGTGANGATARIHTRNIDAFDLYLQARSQRETGSFGGYSAAESLLKQALTIDPNFIEAKIELASLYLAQEDTGLMDERAAFATTMAITDQVLTSNPDNVAAQAIKVFTESLIATREGELTAAFGAFEEMLALIEEDPTQLEPRIFLANLSRNNQQLKQALQAVFAALENDPLNPSIYQKLSHIHRGLAQWSEARAALIQSLEIEPAQPNIYWDLAALSLQAGDGLDYLQQFLRAMEIDPVDHEIPGMIARYLYLLELVDQGDRFKDQVLAVAPTSSIAYRIELLRAIAIDDEKAAAAAARRAIEDDADDRRAGFSRAVRYLLRVAVTRGAVAEEFAYLEKHAPGILDIEGAPVPQKYRRAQRYALPAWYTIMPKDELYRHMDQVWQVFEALGLDTSENADLELYRLALRGEVAKATEIALKEIFTEPVALNLGWERRFKQPLYAEIVEDPRIQEAMKMWQEDEDALREQIRHYLADRNDEQTQSNN